MAQHPDVLIVGGGVIGLTTAYFLAQENCRVEIVDQAEFGREASWAGAGILCPREPSPKADPVAMLYDRSFAMFPQLSAELREQTNIDNGYLVCGGLEFGADHCESEWSSGITSWEKWDEAKCRRLLPDLGEALGLARWLPNMAQLRNPRHMKALLAALGTRNVTLSPFTPVLELIRNGDKITGVRTANGTKTAGQILLTTGAWTDLLLEHVDLRTEIKPIRGQIVLLRTTAPVIRPILLCGPRYVVPRPDGNVLIGSTEEDVGFDKRTTAHAATELMRFACGLVPALADAQMERTWAGLRPGSPDGLPFLGHVPGFSNLFLAAGHFRSGIQLSPGTALAMKELLLGEELSFSLRPFRVDR